MEEFQQFLWTYNYQTVRVAFLYGYFGDGPGAAGVAAGTGTGDPKHTTVVAIYEPPQESSASSFELLPDPLAARTAQLAELMGLRRVGWIVSHPPREKGFFLSAQEVIAAAELQLESAGGIEDTPFVTVKCTLDTEGTGQVVVEGFQVSRQCMEMAAEGALELAPGRPGSCKVAPAFTAVLEGRAATLVDCTMFLMNVPIATHNNPLLLSLFPRHNRVTRPVTINDLKTQLAMAGKGKGWRFAQLLYDFSLLLFLGGLLDMATDYPLILAAASSPDGSIRLDEGYELLIKSFAGIN